MTALTRQELDALPRGTRIHVLWSGGNGPHEYLLDFWNGVPYAVMERDWDDDSPMHWYNSLGGFVGPEHPFTQVWEAIRE